MSKITKGMMADAIAIDKAEHGDDFGTKMTLYTDNTVHVEDKFAEDERYLEAMSNFHETTLGELDLEGDEVLNPKEFASNIKGTFETIANQFDDLGLTAELEYDKHDHIEAKIYTPEGEYVGSGSVYHDQFDPNTFESHALAIESLKQGIDDLRLEASIQKVNESSKMASKNAKPNEGLMTEVENQAESGFSK